ncbi:MAG: hypothetical protein K0S02_5435, partial [Achromobacter mucicolens]|uniref:hypothetical protein n=1 Tax=Achromobacter mucicolens TaxID=1389922 RepID=UPI00242A5213
GARDAVLPGSLVCALQDLWTGQEICGAAELLPRGRRQSASGLWDVVAAGACARAQIGFRMTLVRGGRAVMGGAATCSHNFPTRTRRPSGTGVQVTINAVAA